MCYDTLFIAAFAERTCVLKRSNNVNCNGHVIRNCPNKSFHKEHLTTLFLASLSQTMIPTHRSVDPLHNPTPKNHASHSISLSRPTTRIPTLSSRDFPLFSFSSIFLFLQHLRQRTLFSDRSKNKEIEFANLRSRVRGLASMAPQTPNPTSLHRKLKNGPRHDTVSHSITTPLQVRHAVVKGQTKTSRATASARNTPSTSPAAANESGPTASRADDMPVATTMETLQARIKSERLERQRELRKIRVEKEAVARVEKRKRDMEAPIVR